MNDFSQSCKSPSARAELSGVLLESVEEVLREPIAEEDVAKSLDRARQLAEVTTPRGRRLTRRLLAAAAVAAAIMFVMLFLSRDWNSAESMAWADVVQAMAKKPWLHYVDMWHDGTKREGWYSANQAIDGNHYTPSGPDHGLEEYVWTDFTRETLTYYFPHANTIVIGTVPKKDWANHKFSAAMMTAFLSGDAGGTIRAGQYEVVDQQQHELVEEGKRCVAYRFRWRDTKIEGVQSATQFVVLVDPDTRLPFRLDLINPSDPKPEKFEQFDYPANGPEDIYALGAPKTAKIVDCSLRSDVLQLATATVAAGCRENVQFSALVVRSSRGWHEGFRVWKKGLRWRVDSSVGSLVRSSEELPAEQAELAGWWRQKADTAWFGPSAIFDGKWHWEYSTETRRPTRAEIDAGADKDARILVSTEKKRLLPWPRDYYWEAEPLCYMGHPTNFDDSPPIGLPIYQFSFGAYCLATVDPKPKHGPSNTVLLELRNPVWKLDDSKDHRWRHPQVLRFWIDPERDYLVMRCDELISREGKEEMIGGFAIEGLTQNPRKQWFPTVVHQFVHILPPDSDKDLEDEILRFYYDFDTPVADILFEAK